MKKYKNIILNMVIEANSQKEANQIFQKEIEKRKNKNSKPKLEFDLNNDGKFDKKDASKAGKTLKKVQESKQ